MKCNVLDDDTLHPRALVVQYVILLWYFCVVIQVELPFAERYDGIVNSTNVTNAVLCERACFSLRAVLT